MKTVHGVLRKKIENNEPLFNVVTNENIGEALYYAKLNGYDNFKIIEQLDRKSCKASIDVRLAAIMADSDLGSYFLNKYINYNKEIRSSYLVKNFFTFIYRISGFSGIINATVDLDMSVLHKFITEDDFLVDELNALSESFDTAHPCIYANSSLVKLIEFHESTK
jgi:hypothetical protein